MPLTHYAIHSAPSLPTTSRSRSNTWLQDQKKHRNRALLLSVLYRQPHIATGLSSTSNRTYLDASAVIPRNISTLLIPKMYLYRRDTVVVTYIFMFAQAPLPSTHSNHGNGTPPPLLATRTVSDALRTPCIHLTSHTSTITFESALCFTDCRERRLALTPPLRKQCPNSPRWPYFTCRRAQNTT